MNQIAITPKPITTALTRAGQIANDVAARNVFRDYQSRKAKNTLRRQAGDLALLAEFLRSTGLQMGDFAQDPEAWRGVTWGLMEDFVSKEGKISLKNLLFLVNATPIAPELHPK